MGKARSLACDMPRKKAYRQINAHRGVRLPQRGLINNFRELLTPLGLERTLVLSAAPFRRDSRSGNGGAQVDLMLHTALSVYFVEIKRQAEIGREVIDEVAEKVKRIRVARGKTIKTALVYSGHLAPIVEAQGYFNAVIDIRDILF